MPHLARVALIVRDYDKALAFYVGNLWDQIELTSGYPTAAPPMP